MPKAPADMACRSSLLAALSLLALATPAAAQTVVPPEPAPAESTDMINFEAEQLTYDENSDVITASGDVVVRHEGEQLIADTIVYNRKDGRVMASGNVQGTSADGTRIIADEMEVTESLKDGVIENVLLILSDRSRLAARTGTRRDGISTLDRAVYSPCLVVDEETGCPQTPLWALKAVRVTHDPVRRRISYRDVRLEALGVPILYLPGFSHPDSYDHSQTGILSPDVSYSRELGAELTIPWYWAIAPDRDLTATAHLYTGVNPVLGVEYRQLFAGGPIRVGGRLTHAPGEVIDIETGEIIRSNAKLRGYFEANGQLEHGEILGDGWRSTFASRLTTDDNFPGRYQISLDTTLRTTYALERFQDNSYIHIGGWFFQGLRAGDRAAATPLALPLVDVRWRPEIEPLGGRLMVAANSLGLYRRDGQTMARALASAQWDRSFLTGMGQRITVTGLIRGDVYSVDDSHLADNIMYAGRDGWRTRVIPLAAIDIEWPFAGPLGNGTQTLTPRVQFVGSTTTANKSIPNEDSRAIDLEESNLFALNRFPGYDRWEGGARITYGMDWRWTKPGLIVSAQFGQSYRLDDQTDVFPDGTGLNTRMSDFVGRMSVQWGRHLEVVQRLRLDKDSFAIRRHETDVMFGGRRTYASIGYLRFNRNINLEDLVDHEEVRVGARIAFARYWAVFGSAVIDLTSAKANPGSDRDGYQPIRHRAGLLYADECFDFSITWRRNYVDNPNARRGNTFLFSISLKNLG
ncbi:MAG: LPS assembly protein LptD [Sphingomonadaceae bacterium]